MNAFDLPAILGGAAVRPQGPPSWPPPDPDVLATLQAAFHDGSWTRYNGQHGERLTCALRDYLGVEHVLLCGSGTFAIELALRALQVGPGDEVVPAAYDYPGNFLNVHAVGAQPVLIDVSPDNWNLDVAKLELALGPRTRAVIVSHLHGGMAPMSAIVDIARGRGVAVIEDAAQMPGGVIQGQRAGTWGDAGVWSFGGSKLLSAGRGGVLFTRRPDVFQRAKTANQRGNILCPLSELQAAVLLPQLAKLDARNAQRARAVQHLADLLSDVPGLRPFRNNVAGSPAYYKVGFQLDGAEFGLDRPRLVAALRAEGIALEEGFPALHVGRSRKRFRAAGPLTEADRAHEATLVLHHPVLLGTEAELEEVATALKKIRGHAERLR